MRRSFSFARSTAVVLTMAAGAGCAGAADLRAAPSLTPLGAVFAPPPVVAAERYQSVALSAWPSPKVPGYYGGFNDFAYRNYYGTSPVAIFSRLPYACGFHGYC